MPTSTLLYLPQHQLRLHPQNMRRFYRDEDVQKMAASIKARHGVIEALQVVPDPERADGYLVVDGNLRLSSARLLGDDCPLLKCEPITADHAEQLLIIATTSVLHFPKDPVSEAMHYKSLVREGYNAEQIAGHTGLNPQTIKNRLRLLDLDQEIQDLVAAGGLPCDRRVADALLQVPDVDARIKLAKRMAASRATIEGCIRAAEHLTTALRDRQAALQTGAPSLARTVQSHPSRSSRVEWTGTQGSVREAVKATCRQCDIRAQHLAGTPEPAWELISHAATDTCAACNLRELRSFCAECPAVDLLRRLAEAATSASAAAAPAAAPLSIAGGRRGHS